MLKNFSKLITKTYSTMLAGKSLQATVQELEKFAPLALAEKWDNVGLLIEPCEKKNIKKIMLTNDLTEGVMREAISSSADLIISYHPPIFAPLKKITQNSWKERIVSLCLNKSIALYSPHTAWDAVTNGTNDWLAAALPCHDVKPIQPNDLVPNAGSGRIFTTDVTLSQAIRAVQTHTGVDVQVAFAENHTLETTIKTVAVCAGSGASVLKDVNADLYITGEMSHHELLDANHRNVTVIVCNHSNSERGFLHKFEKTLHEMLQGECEIFVSKVDKDPLKVFVKA